MGRAFFEEFIQILDPSQVGEDKKVHECQLKDAAFHL